MRSRRRLVSRERQGPAVGRREQRRDGDIVRQQWSQRRRTSQAGAPQARTRRLSVCGAAQLLDEVCIDADNTTDIVCVDPGAGTHIASLCVFRRCLLRAICSAAGRRWYACVLLWESGARGVVSCQLLVVAAVLRQRACVARIERLFCSCRCVIGCLIARCVCRPHRSRRLLERALVVFARRRRKRSCRARCAD